MVQLKLKLLTAQLLDTIVNIKRVNKPQLTQSHQFMLGLEVSYTELNLTIFQNLKASVKNLNKLQLKLSKLDNTLKIWLSASLTRMMSQETHILTPLNTFKPSEEDLKRNSKRNDL
jgi:hypothetical protein